MNKNKQKIKVSISPEGTITFIYTDQLVGLLSQEGAVIKRVSHVEPCEGGWSATMVDDGTVLGPYRLRSEALEAEVAYLERKLFGQGEERSTLSSAT